MSNTEKIIYRVQHQESGLGPFHHSERCVDAISYVTDPSDFPMMERFRDCRWQESHYFGWKSISDLLSFIRNINMLRVNGFVVVKLLINTDNSLFYPDGQVAFLKRNIKETEVISWRNVVRRAFEHC